MLTKSVIASLLLPIASEALSACSNLGELFKSCGVVPQMVPSKLTCRDGIANFDYEILNRMKDKTISVTATSICHWVSFRKYGTLKNGEEIYFENPYISRLASSRIYPGSSIKISCEVMLAHLDKGDQDGVIVASWCVPIPQTILKGADHHAFYANGFATIEIKQGDISCGEAINIAIPQDLLLDVPVSDFDCDSECKQRNKDRRKRQDESGGTY
jgi:hypothetical protein